MCACLTLLTESSALSTLPSLVPALTPKESDLRVIKNCVCLDVGQLHVLFMQINTYLPLPVGAERHLSLPLNIHECAGQREKEPFRAALYPLLLISAHILMERIKSEWPNREFHSDNGIHHTSVLKEESLLISLFSGTSVCDAQCRNCVAG